MIYIDETKFNYCENCGSEENLHLIEVGQVSFTLCSRCILELIEKLENENKNK